MRFLLLSVLMCLAASPAMAACEGFKNSLSALEHAMGIENIPPSSAKDSSEVIFRGEKLTFITRRAAENAVGSNLGVYQYKSGQWQLIKSITAGAGEITFKQDNQKITFYPVGSRLALLSITAHDLI